MSLKLDIYTIKGETEGSLELNEAIFAAKVNPALIAQAVRVYQSNQRQGTAVARDRGDVNYTKAKMYRQKGTGRARHGAKSAPLFVGGGVAHGPSGTQNYSLTLTKKMRRLALAGVLTEKVAQKQLMVVKDLDKIDGKTKSFIACLKSLKIPANKPVLLILDKSLNLVLRAVKSLGLVHPTQAKRLNTVEILHHAHVIATPEALDIINEQFTVKKSK